MYQTSAVPGDHGTIDKHLIFVRITSRQELFPPTARTKNASSNALFTVLCIVKVSIVIVVPGNKVLVNCCVPTRGRQGQLPHCLSLYPLLCVPEFPANSMRTQNIRSAFAGLPERTFVEQDEQRATFPVWG